MTTTKLVIDLIPFENGQTLTEKQHKLLMTYAMNWKLTPKIQGNVELFSEFPRKEYAEMFFWTMDEDCDVADFMIDYTYE